LKQKGIKVAAASRTSAPEIAKDMLKLLRLPSKPTLSPSSSSLSASLTSSKAIDVFDVLEAYPGSKISHFERIAETTGIPYEEMLFFDDENRNKEVEVLGVTMWLVRDGVGNDEVDMAVLRWRGKMGRDVE
jgi:magnesium-dependent phosphatase 1